LSIPKGAISVPSTLPSYFTPAAILRQQCHLSNQHHPGWLKIISSINPLPYEVNALRSQMLAGGISQYGIGLDLLILVLATTILVVIGSMLYPRVAT
jgi:ABC-type multidrug transport system permease subunit